MEDELFSGQRTNPAERIYRLQREVLQFRKATAPLVDPIEQACGRGTTSRSTRRSGTTSAT